MTLGLVLLYVREMLGYVIVLLPVYVLCRFLFIKRKRKKLEWKRECLLTFFSLYCIALGSQTIIPYWTAGIESDTGEPFLEFSLVNDLSHLNLIPFRTMYEYVFTSNTDVNEWSSLAIINMIGNVALFVPIGFLAPIIWKRLCSFKGAFILGLSVTCFIEFVQYFIGRSSDIDDVLLNTIGVLIGYYLLLVLHSLMKKRVVKVSPINKFN